MGLDMYLHANKYLGCWDHSKPHERKAYQDVVSALGLEPSFKCDDSPSLTVRLTVGYWRKANAIHNWFVQNVQDGKDECHESHVERKQLAALRTLCQSVLDGVETVDGKIKESTTYHLDGRVEEYWRDGQVVAQKSIAEKTLPTKSGFFFGGTGYDECYLKDLRDTVDIIDRVLNHNDMKGFEFSYRASW